MNQSYQNLFLEIKKHDRFLISTHTGPDHDGIGAEIGLDFLLRTLGKECLIVNHDPVHPNKRFMDTENRIHHLAEFPDHQELEGYMYVGLDVSDKKRLGAIERFIHDDLSNLILIDHHDSGLPDGSSLFQFAQIGSSCEIVYELYRLAGIRPVRDVAVAIYSGIVADTGSFRFSKTSAVTHEIAAELLNCGVQPHVVADRLYSNSPKGRLLAKQMLYQTLQIRDDEKLAYFRLTKEQLNSIGIVYDDLGGIINELLEPADINAAILFFQKEPNLTKVSVRSKGDLNMLFAVEPFGGGGHKNACGATIMLDLESTISEFIPVACRCIANQKATDSG